jgi:hypothetical protein
MDPITIMAITTSAVTTAVITVTAQKTAGGPALGGMVIVLLIAALVVKEIAAHAGNERLIPLSKGLNIAVLPLSVAAGFVIVQQLAGIGA